MRTIIIDENTYVKLFRESRGVPDKAIDDAQGIVNDFIDNLDDMYDLAINLETDFLSNQDDEDDDYMWQGSTEWEEEFSYDFMSSGWDKEYYVNVFYSSSDRNKATTDTDGEISINFAHIKRLIDKEYERLSTVNQTARSEDSFKQIVMNYLYPIILHELTHDVDEDGGTNDHIWLGSYHRMNEEDLREVLYFFADNELNARISSSYALMSNYLHEMMVNPQYLMDKTITSQDVYDMILEMMEDSEDELHINHMSRLLNLIGEDGFSRYSYKNMIQNAEKENSHPYSLAYDLYLNDRRLKNNRKLHQLFYDNYKAAVRYVYHFYNNLLKNFQEKILRTSIKAVQDYMEGRSDEKSYN